MIINNDILSQKYEIKTIAYAHKFSTTEKMQIYSCSCGILKSIISNFQYNYVHALVIEFIKLWKFNTFIVVIYFVSFDYFGKLFLIDARLLFSAKNCFTVCRLNAPFINYLQIKNLISTAVKKFGSRRNDNKHVLCPD